MGTFLAKRHTKPHHEDCSFWSVSASVDLCAPAGGHHPHHHWCWCRCAGPHCSPGLRAHCSQVACVAKGVLIGRLISRGRRSVDEIEINTDIVSEIASNELEQCTQLLFCSAAADPQISLDKNVDDLRRIV